ncbi:hypothetical protein FACS1894196_2980 [Clostridia bacterium]|nr:hypothetical protein FACS1894196_2980 [Clostridia bacterium]
MFDEVTILEEIVEQINADKYGMRRFLQATPYVEHDHFSFKGLIDNEVFLKLLYSSSVISEEMKEELYQKLIGNGALNTFFILGYQGCGKTTFINALLNYYSDQTGNELNKSYLVDCDKFGVSSSELPLDAIFKKKLLKYILNHKQTLINFVSFYNANHISLHSVSISTQIHEMRDRVNDFISGNRNTDNPDDTNFLEEYINKFSLKESLYTLMLMFMSEYYDDVNKISTPIFLFVDNLDYIDDTEQLEDFMKAIKDFTTDFSEIFTSLKLCSTDSTIVHPFFTQKIKFLVAMRETTQASIAGSHAYDFFGEIHPSYDMTEWYDKDKIAKLRLNFIGKSNNLSDEKRREAALIGEIFGDIDKNYTQLVFMPLFNNNYRRTVRFVSTIIIEHPQEFLDYTQILRRVKQGLGVRKSNTGFRNLQFALHGARGILLKFMIDAFNADDKDGVSCLRKIGAMDLQNRKNNDVSVSRMILSYLSHYSETLCDSARKCVSFQKTVEAFDGIFSKDEIIKSVLNMFLLKDSMWSHLVSFSRFKSDESIEVMMEKDDFSSLDLSKTNLHYSCAGKIYLEVITSHFEFFVARTFHEKYPALFCATNWQHGSTKYRRIIDGVLREVTQCCHSLKSHNEKIRSLKSETDENMSISEYLESPYVQTIKKKYRERNYVKYYKQFHEERIIDAHIGYIDRFRLYVLSFPEGVIGTDKSTINEYLCNIINEYLNLLDGVPTTPYSKTVLHSYSNEQYKKIKASGFTDFRSEIKKDI